MERVDETGGLCQQSQFVPVPIFWPLQKIFDIGQIDNWNLAIACMNLKLLRMYVNHVLFKNEESSHKQVKAKAYTTVNCTYSYEFEDVEVVNHVLFKGEESSHE